MFLKHMQYILSWIKQIRYWCLKLSYHCVICMPYHTSCCDIDIVSKSLKVKSPPWAFKQSLLYWFSVWCKMLDATWYHTGQWLDGSHRLYRCDSSNSMLVMVVRLQMLCQNNIENNSIGKWCSQEDTIYYSWANCVLPCTLHVYSCVHFKNTAKGYYCC